MKPRSQLAHICHSLSRFLYHAVARSISTPHGPNASPSQVKSLEFVRFPQQFTGTHLYSWTERGSVRVNDVRAHCYCASLVRTLFISHMRATSCISSMQNIELMTFVLTWCANIFVECSVTPIFFGRSLPFLIHSIILN